MTRHEKLALIREQEARGLTQAAFCASQSINPSTFQQWKYHRSKEWKATPTFVELVAKPKDAMPLVVVAGRFRVEVPAGFDKAHLTSLLHSLPC